MKQIRWGIIGCGDVTEVKSGPGFQKATGSALVAVMRRDAAKAADYAKRHGVPRWYDDADRLIADPEVDAVYIATPPGSHEFYARKVCAAGKPCYVEKPMARNAPEAQRMVDAFAAARLPLFVAYYRRALPRFVKVREIVDGGAIGRILRISYRYADAQMIHRETPVPWRLQAEHAGAGLFLDLGSHALDLLDRLLGPLQNVRGSAASVGRMFDVEDQVQLTFTTLDGALGDATWSFTSDARADQYHIVGDRGELRFACFANEPITLAIEGRGMESFDVPHPPHVAQPLIQTIVDELLGVTPPGSCPSTGESGLRSQRVMDQALQSYYGGREDGFWNRPWAKT
ncbi:MAG TPA: Gfo/Idh/MocA family oxidoreductase [Tepidisphaeraceae bacterium]|nr:Gfo/Idh/MocA family oxidoreductase [Tepidisphaeraceae bacterium]